MINAIYNDETRTRTNAEILDETYYEYHGKYDDGNSAADALETLLAEGFVMV